jgi:heat shock protein HspQ
VNGCASLATVELDDLNTDLVIQMDPQYSEHAADFEKIPEQKNYCREITVYFLTM